LIILIVLGEEYKLRTRNRHFICFCLLNRTFLRKSYFFSFFRSLCSV
jgi:hypothetical protein